MKQNIISIILVMALLFTVVNFSCCGKKAVETLENSSEESLFDESLVSDETSSETSVEESAISEVSANAESSVSAESSKAESKLPEKPSTTVWTEVPIINNPERKIFVSYKPFDLKKIITGANYSKDFNYNSFVFKGTIISRKEYEITWEDDNGEKIIPISCSILEVKINKEYYGKRPIKGDIIKIYCTFSLSVLEDMSILVKNNSEYVFASSCILDKKFTDFELINNPGDKTEKEKHADIMIGNPRYSMFPVDDGQVTLYREYFDHDEEALKKAIPYKNAKTDKLTDPKALEFEMFIALNSNDFEKAFLKLFENPDNLPTLDGDF